MKQSDHQLNCKWIKIFISKFFNAKDPLLVQDEDWEQYYTNNSWNPVQCQPFYWKTHQKIGTIITDHLLHPAEFELYQFIVVNTVCTKVVCNSKGLIHTIVPVTDLTKNHDFQKKFKQYPQQWDFSAPGRVKHYFGRAHYCHPVLGNRNELLHKNVKHRYREILQPGKRNSDGWGNVITNLQEIDQHYPRILKLINEFICYRYKAIDPTFTLMTNMQYNAYVDGKGFIQNHFDSFNHYWRVLLNKLVSNSGLHTQMKSFTKIIYNPTMYHPLLAGMWLEFTKWQATWFQHCKLPWMNSPNTRGSVTVIFRLINTEEAIFYPFPSDEPFHSNPQPTTQSMLVYQEYIKSITKH
ncbi:MAG: hypothetical protein GY928_33260 [Colwellia sp.]|nr:hypothetical protein [Colwellia sp.]